jgi:endonuclease YncB( thermonuclease family)
MHVIMGFSIFIWLLAMPLAQAQQILIIDGDTLRLDGVEIRLEGIDAPEWDQICSKADGKEFWCGASAMQKLSKIISQGPLTCNSDGLDRYGRILAHCVVGQIDINREMVSSGYAMAYVKYSGEYLADENVAKEQKSGLWAGFWQEPWKWRKLHPHKHGYLK